MKLKSDQMPQENNIFEILEPDSLPSMDFMINKMNQPFKIAPLKGLRTGTAKLQQVSILLGWNPNSECILNSPTANSTKATTSDYAAPEYATFF